MTAILRPARSTDAGKTGAILWAFCHDTPWMPELYTGAETVAFCGTMIDRGWMTVAELDGRIVGFLARHKEEINALYVAKEQCGAGFGLQLLDHAKQGSDRLSLWTFDANVGAQRFYRREGFVETARTQGAGNQENLPDIAFMWTKETA